MRSGPRSGGGYINIYICLCICIYICICLYIYIYKYLHIHIHIHIHIHNIHTYGRRRMRSQYRRAPTARWPRPPPRSTAPDVCHTLSKREFFIDNLLSHTLLHTLSLSLSHKHTLSLAFGRSNSRCLCRTRPCLPARTHWFLYEKLFNLKNFWQ